MSDLVETGIDGRVALCRLDRPDARNALSPELMDQPSLAPAEHEKALRGLARINALSDSAGIIWRPLLELALAVSQRTRVEAQTA